MTVSDRGLRVAIAIGALSALFIVVAVPCVGWNLYHIRAMRLDLARMAEAEARVARADRELPDAFGWRPFCEAEARWNERAAAAYRSGADRPWARVDLPPEPVYSSPRGF